MLSSRELLWAPVPRLESLLPHQKKHSQTAHPCTGLSNSSLRQRRSGKTQTNPHTEAKERQPEPLFDHGHACKPPRSNWLISANVFTAYYYQSVNSEAFTQTHRHTESIYTLQSPEDGLVSFFFPPSVISEGGTVNLFIVHLLLYCSLFLKGFLGIQGPWRSS